MPIIESNGLPSINYVRCGPRGAAPLVFLHPVGLDLTWWGQQFEDFGTDHDVIAFDMPGHGLSGRLTSAPSFDLMADALQAVIAHSGARTVHLVGMSVGGMIAQVFTLRWPAVVESLTLVATLCTFADPVREALRERARVARTHGMLEIARLSNERWFPAAFRECRPDVLDRATTSLLAHDPEFHAAMWEMIANLNLEDRIQGITCPTLVVTGSEDINAPISAAHKIADLIQGSRLEEMAGLGHFPPFEAAAAFNALLRDFSSD